MNAEQELTVSSLEEFILDRERLEELTSNFNVFKSIGNVITELMHSDFLAFVMAP